MSVAAPGPIPVTATGAVRAWAGTVTAAGTAATSASLVSSGTTVSVVWAAFSVTVHRIVAPVVNLAEHARSVSVGGGS